MLFLIQDDTSCAMLAYKHNGTIKVISACGVVFCLGIWLGLYGSLAVQADLIRLIRITSFDCYHESYHECKPYYALLMQLFGIVFSSLGCVTGAISFATAFSAAETGMIPTSVHNEAYNSS